MWPMSWWRWTCSERGACSFNLPRPSSLWAEETFFLSVYTFFEDFSAAQPCYNRSTTSLFMISFLSRTIDFFFFFLSLFIYGWPRPVSSRSAKQLGWRSPPIVIFYTFWLCVSRPLLPITQSSLSSPPCPLYFHWLCIHLSWMIPTQNKILSKSI